MGSHVQEIKLVMLWLKVWLVTSTHSPGLKSSMCRKITKIGSKIKHFYDVQAKMAESRQQVSSQGMFNKIFVEQSKLGFHRPKKDY